MIQTLRNQKAQQGTANASGNNGSNSTDEQKSRRQLAPVTAISKVAKKNFLKLPPKYQTAEGKRQAVELAIKNDKKHRYSDGARYWDDNEVEGHLLDRAHDLKEFCEAQQLNYTAVKQHLVIEGRGVMKDIVLNGVENYKTLILKFGDLLYDRERECPVTRVEQPKTEQGTNA